MMTGRRNPQAQLCQALRVPVPPRRHPPERDLDAPATPEPREDVEQLLPQIPVADPRQAEAACVAHEPALTDPRVRPVGRAPGEVLGVGLEDDPPQGPAVREEAPVLEDADDGAQRRDGAAELAALPRQEAAGGRGQRRARVVEVVPWAEEDGVARARTCQFSRGGQ